MDKDILFQNRCFSLKFVGTYRMPFFMRFIFRFRQFVGCSETGRPSECVSGGKKTRVASGAKWELERHRIRSRTRAAAIWQNTASFETAGLVCDDPRVLSF